MDFLPQPHKILLLINGGRKPVAKNLLSQLEIRILEHNSKSRVIVSASLEEAEEHLNLAVQEQFDSVWIGGGDGSLLHAVNILAGSKIALGVVPLGTVNALARSINIPLDPIMAVEKLLSEGFQFPYDVGLVNRKHYFLCFGSIGYDAKIVNDVPKKIKRLFGRVAYGLYGITNILSRKSAVHLNFSYLDKNGGTHCTQGYGIVFSNIINYAGAPVFHTASPSNNRLDAMIFRRNNPLDFIKWLVKSFKCNFSGNGKLPPQYEEIIFLQMSVEFETKAFLQLDGDSIELENCKEITIECLPGKILFWGLQKS